MANRYAKPREFDGEKFATRYSLNALRLDFWADENFVYVRDGITLPDDPPVFEAPTGPKPTLAERVAALEARVPAVVVNRVG